MHLDWLEALTQLHFIRPQWLLLLLPAPLFLLLIRHQQRAAGIWQKVIDPALLPAMLKHNHQQQQNRQWPSWPLWLFAWIIAAVALAGPSYKKMPQPVAQNEQALIILLDMSASMAATDIKPSRATRAVQKITDILRARPDGLTALITYAGDAHTVTPLTTDTRTITSLVPAISPFIMPSAGSRPDKAIALARTLAANSGIKQADVLLITDGLLKKDTERMAKELRAGLNLKIIALGSSEGGPVPLPNGGFLRDGRDQIVVPKLDENIIAQVSQELAVPWRKLSLNDSDWQSLLSNASLHNLESSQSEHASQFDLWRDDGYWLIFLILPFALLLFRKGVLVAVTLMPWLLASSLLINSNVAEASPWQTPDQQGAQLFEQAPEQAAQYFNNPAWKASAQYKAGDYESAAQGFQQLPKTANNQYNLGNALAQSGKLEEALKAYDNALAQQPDFEQAAKNRALVEELLKQQQQQNDQSQDNQNQNKQDKSEQNQQGQNQQNQDGQNQDDRNQQGQSQQNQNNQDQDKQNQDSPNQQSDAQNEQADSEKDTDSNQAKNSEAEEQQGQQASKATEDQNEQSEQQANAAQAQPEGLSREEQEAMEKWLKQVPDNPGNLLQRKFLHQYRQRQQDDFEQGDAPW